MLVNLLIFALGACVGSFLNVCVYRLPHDQSIITPPSHCTACKRRLKPIDLIPLLSYFLLRGKCRFCGKKISARYPWVEFLTGLIFLLIKLQFGLSAFWAYAIFASLLIVIFFIDLKHLVILDELCYLGITVGLVHNLILGSILSSLAGAALGFGLLWLIGWLGKKYYKKEALGEGDLKLAAMLGAFLGWEQILLVIFLAYLLGAIAGLMLLGLKIKKMDEYIPFGPALAAGAFIAMFWGKFLINFYLAHLI